MAEWLFPISPIAASRPRVSKHGAYFTGAYKKFRKEMIELVPAILGDGFIPFDKQLKVDVEFYIKQPAKTKLASPRADIDNFLKACFDSFNGWLWEDDRQIIQVYATKEWAPKDSLGYFVIGVEEIERIQKNVFNKTR
mgnify:CR=1 FL=1|tara:strand:- start:331 stop:744 length:414 start_codon:yes stop_codon:yes gene_type:complete